MKNYALFIAMLAIFSVQTAFAGVLNHIYVEGGVVVPSGGSIDNSRTNEEIRNLHITSVGYVEQKGQTSYSALVGYEVVQRSWYTFCTEFQVSGASFHWDGKPIMLYNQRTGKATGTYFLTQDKEVQLYSFNVKARFKPNKYLRPFVELGGGPMIAKSTDRSYVPAINWDLLQPSSETGAAAKIGGGLGILFLPSVLGDRVELIVNGGYVKGFASTLAKEMAYPYWGGGLKIRL